VANGADVGASFCITVQGETVVDLWGGFADEARTRPWRNDTIVGVYSTTKTMTALTGPGHRGHRLAVGGLRYRPAALPVGRVARGVFYRSLEPWCTPSGLRRLERPPSPTPRTSRSCAPPGTRAWHRT
jgi:hypothetical protein